MTVLLVDDDPAGADLVRRALVADVGGNVVWVETFVDAVTNLEARSISCIVLSLGRAGRASLEQVDILTETNPHVPIVVLTEDDDRALALEALRHGAQDCLSISDVAIRRLSRAVVHAIERGTIRAAGVRDKVYYRAVIEALGEGVLVGTADGLVTTANPEAARLLGLSIDQLLGRIPVGPRFRTVDEHGQPLSKDARPAARAMRTGEAVVDFTMGVHLPAGGIRWLKVSAHPMKRAPDAIPYAVVASLRDVTEKRAAIHKAQFQSSLLEAAGQAMIATDAAGTIMYWNHTAERMYGWSAAETIGRNVRDDLPAIQLEGHAGHILAELSAGRAWSGDLVVRRRDGTTFSAFVTDTPVFDQDGELSGMIAVSTDITDRKRAEVAMRRLSAIVESTGDAIISNTLEGTITSWNRGAETLYGYRADEVIDRNLTVLVPDDVQDQLFDVLRRVGSGETLSRFETTRRRKDGQLVDVSLTVSPVLGDDGSVVGCSAIARDITARAEAERALNHQAAHDTLTGLPNRVLLEDRLVQALGRAWRHDERVAVLFLDLDGFKVVNDGLGHLAGDELLVEVARRLVAHVRPDDTVARFGGDEFAIVCEVAATAVAMQLGSRLLECLRPAFSVQGNEIFITGSVGLVLAEHDAKPDALLRDADAAMYRAKERGRSRVEVFDDNLRERAASKLHSATALRRALERGELRVFFQPVVAVDTGQPLAVEALLRWQHPERGLVAPDEIIPLAEDTGMIVPIGRWVLQEALRQRAGWEAVVPGLEPVRLSVNLSARQLSEAGLVADIKAALDAYGTDPSSIILEITESVLMSDPDSLSTVKAIHDLGISLHVDDFGTGYSSLAYLKTLPVDALKIDRVFVDGLGSDGDDRAIVTAVIALARAMSLGVIAEGVETDAQLRVLRDLGCDHAQGYLFAPPMPFDELVAWLRADASRTRRPSRTSARPGPMRRSPIAGGVA